MSVNLSVNRFICEPDWTMGKFYEDEKMTGYTMEDEIRNVKIKGETAIWGGKYKLESRFSPKFSYKFYWNRKTEKLLWFMDYNKLPKIQKADFAPHLLFWITNVPKFDYILIHWGNTDDDTDGCLIIGDKMGTVNGKGAVINSKKFYIDFYQRNFPKLDANSYITIENPIQ